MRRITSPAKRTTNSTEAEKSVNQKIDDDGCDGSINHQKKQKEKRGWKNSKEIIERKRGKREKKLRALRVRKTQIQTPTTTLLVASSSCSGPQTLAHQPTRISRNTRKLWAEIPKSSSFATKSNAIYFTLFLRALRFAHKTSVFLCSDFFVFTRFFFAVAAPFVGFNPCFPFPRFVLPWSCTIFLRATHFGD